MSELSTMPIFELKYFARWAVKSTEAYFENPDVKRRFKKWKREQERTEQYAPYKEEEDKDTKWQVL